MTCRLRNLVPLFVVVSQHGRRLYQWQYQQQVRGPSRELPDCGIDAVALSIHQFWGSMSRSSEDIELQHRLPAGFLGLSYLSWSSIVK